MGDRRASEITSVIYFLEDASAMGGVRKHVIDSAAELSRRGYSVSVVSRFHSDDNEIGVKVTSIHDKGYEDLVRTNGDQQKTEEIFQKRVNASRRIHSIFGTLDDHTVVIAVQYGCLVDLEHAHLLKRTDRSFHLVGAYHSSWEYARTAGYYNLLQRLLSECDKSVFLTNEDHKKFQAEGNSNGVAIPNAIAGGTVRPRDQRRPAFAYVGRLHPEKGVRELVNVWAFSREVGTPLPPLRIFGTGPLQSELENLIQTEDLSEIVEIAGFTSEPQEVLANHVAVVSCSPREGFPMMLLEAGSVGTPCVVYDAGPGTREFATSHDAGFVVPLGDQRAFIKLALELFEDTERWSAKSESAKAAADLYAPDQIYDRWELLFAEISGIDLDTITNSTEVSMSKTEPSGRGREIRYALPASLDPQTTTLQFHFQRDVPIKSFVAIFRFWDATGSEIKEAVEGLTYSDFFNAQYAYVPSSDKFGIEQEMTMFLPTLPQAQRIELQIHPWDKQVDPRSVISGVFVTQRSELSTASFKLKESE